MIMPSYSASPWPTNNTPRSSSGPSAYPCASPAPFEISTPFFRPSMLPLCGPYFSNSRFMMPVPRVSDRNSPW